VIQFSNALFLVDVDVKNHVFGSGGNCDCIFQYVGLKHFGVNDPL